MLFSNKKARLLLLASMLFIFMACKNLIDAANLREEVCLNGEWLFVGVTTKETDPIPASGYTTCRVPGSWAYRPLNYTLTDWSTYHQGWYKLPLSIPSSWFGRRIKIYFERVNHFAMIFINGTKVGQGHQESFTPFEVDITTFCTPGGTNTLYVYNEDTWRSSVSGAGAITPGSKPGWIAPTGIQAYNSFLVAIGDYMTQVYDSANQLSQGFGNFEKGIWGSVYLRSYNPVYVEDVFIITSVRQNNKITAKVYIKNDDSIAHTVSLVNEVMKDGQVKFTVGDSPQEVTNADLTTESRAGASTTVTIPAKSSKCIEVSKAPWDSSIKLWGIGKAKIKNGANFDYIDYGDPILYFLATSLVEGGQTVDKKYSRFGFREIWVRQPNDTYNYPAPYNVAGTYDYHFFLNGKRIFFQANALDCSQESFTWNRQNILLFYRAEQGRNMNFTRIHVISAPSIFFDVADEVGMLVVPEGHSRNNGNSPSQYCKALNSYTNAYVTRTQTQAITDATAKWITNMKTYFRDYTKAHRNHPSIAMWANGNEIYQKDQSNSWTTNTERANKQGRTETFMEFDREAIRPADPTRKISSSTMSRFIKFNATTGVCSYDSDMVAALYSEDMDFIDVRKAFLYEARMEWPFTAAQAFTNWQTNFRRPVMNTEEELDSYAHDKIDIGPGTDIPNLTATTGVSGTIYQAFLDCANFFYVDPNPAIRTEYHTLPGTPAAFVKNYTNFGNCIARAAAYQIPRFNVFSIPMRSPWDPANAVVFGSAGSSPFISWPSLSGEGVKARYLFPGSSRTTYNWFDSTKGLYNTNFLYDRIRDGFANCRPYGAMPKFYEAGADWYTDFNTNGLPRVPEVIITLKNSGAIMPGAYIFLEPSIASGLATPPVGVMTDSTGKAWFTLKEPGNYNVVYYNGVNRLSMQLSAPVINTLYKDWTTGGYNNIQNFDIDVINFPSPDTTPPAAVANLSAGSATSGSITLNWTAVGDDGTTGTASSYSIKYLANIPITDSNFASATSITAPTPTLAGTQQTVTVNSLNASTVYYFALKVTDDATLTSSISNIVNAQTLASADVTVPAQITTLTTSGATTTSMVLTWTAVGDDGTTGTAAIYDIRYMAGAPITSSNFSSATPYTTGVPSPAVSGTQQTVTVNGLTANTLYYFAMKAADEVPNTSLFSNVASGQTQIGDITAPAQITTLATGSITTTSITLTWTAVGDDSATGTVTSYEIRYSNTQITSSNFTSAIQVSGPIPTAAGTQQTVTVNSLTPNTLYYFAMKSADEVPNISILSNIASGQTQTPDTTAPAVLNTLLAASATQTSVTLTWTSVGDDGTTGTAASYELRYATYSISSSNFANTLRYTTNVPTPAIAGTLQTVTVNNLSAGIQYWFAMKVADEIPNTSGLSNVANIQTQSSVDTTAPAQITSLAVSTYTATTATLRWTAVGDDGTTGTANSYDIKYATYNITSSNFTNATSCIGEPTPTVSGTNQIFLVNGLSASTMYYFAMKVSDEYPNSSVLSNVASVQTAIPPDTTAPADILNLAASNPTSGSVNLTWTSVGDDGNSGTAAGYDIRYMEGVAISSSNWSVAIQVTGEPTPKVSGNPESFTVNQLTSNTQYYFAIKAGDESSNWSSISNSPNAQTLTSTDITSPATINTLTVNNSATTSTSITLTWTSVGDDGTTGTATEYDIRYSNEIMTDLTHWLSTALQATGETTPKISGSNESFTVNGLQSDTIYYFQMRVRDEVGTNWSTLSNQVSGQTSAPLLDTTPPASINNLLAVNPTMTTVTLNWTSTGDDDNSGTSKMYDIRYMANMPVTAGNWDSATQCISEPTPQIAGTPQMFVVNGLSANTQYYFAIKAVDQASNWSNVSNQTSATTASSVVYTTPVSEWHLDEGLGTYTLDTSVSGSNNTASIPAGTGATWVTPGKVGNSAVNFDGTNSYLLVMDNPTLAVTSELTIEAWVKSDVNTADGSTRRIVEKGVYALGASNQDLFKIMVSTGVDISVARSLTYSGFTAGLWHYLVGTYDADGGAYNMKLYQDGILVASSTVLGNIATNTSNLFIGASGTTSNRFDGTIDEVKIYDKALNQEEIVARYGGSTPGPDITSPGTITLTAGNSQVTTVTLTWNAVGDDGNTGTASSYDIRYLAGTSITDSNWTSATQCTGEPTPQAAGNIETYTVSNLSPGTLYYFAIKATDDVSLAGSISNSPDATTQASTGDVTAPGTINTLTTSNLTQTSVTLNWTAVGDDGTTGTAASYDIRYLANTSITSGSWDSATQCSGETTPKATGNGESFTVNNLVSGITYYFAMKIGDEMSNMSGISNVVNATISGTTTDTTAPSAVSTLSVISVSSTSLTIRWTSKGDDANIGTATSYDIRYKTGGTITSSNWDGTTQCTNEPAPVVAGTIQNLIISGLSSNTTYYIGMKVGDEIPNWSGLSNIAIGTTAEGQGSGIPASVSYLAATPLDGGKLQLNWIPSTSNDVVAYNVYMSTSDTFNYTAPNFIVSSTTTAMTISGLTNNQQYSFVVRAVDNSANEDSNTYVIAETAATSVDDTVTQLLVPRNGMTISGKRVTLLADAIIGDLSNVESVTFEFKRSDETTWTKMPVIVSGLTNPDITSPYYVQWDVSNLDAGYQYNVRAVVTDINGIKETKPGYVTIIIGDGGVNTDLVEGINYKYERIDNRRDNIVRMVEPATGQISYVKISSGVLDQVTTRLKITINPASAPTLNKNLVLIGYVHNIYMDSGQKTFSKDLEIALPYKDTDSDNRIDDKDIGTNKLYVYSCQGPNNPWVKETDVTIDKTDKVIIIKTNHLSYYGIFASLSSDLSVSHVYPNPYKPSLGHTKIFFANLTSRAKVQIFDVSGDLVYEEEKDTPTGELGWDVKNSKGEPIASGVYIYLITNNSGQTKKGKLAIIR